MIPIPSTDLQIAILEHQDPAVARRIHAVLMLAYAQEAALLQLRHFAPLERSVEDVQASTDTFLGALAGAELHGCLSYGPDDEAGQLCISALVVHPAQQRRGIARALMRQLLQLQPGGRGQVFAVSTGALNAPALALYRQLGFVDYRWGTIGPEQLPLIKLRRLPPPERAAC